MADRNKEVKEAQKKGESIVANKFATESNSSVNDTRSNMYSMSYEDAKNTYGQGVGNNKYFMSRSDFEKGKAKYEVENAPKEEAQPSSPKSSSEVANRFADKGKTWNDVKTENGNDPAKIADYLNNNPEYKPGDLTKKGMEEMGYKQDEEGKWTNDDVLNEFDKISETTPEAEKVINSVTNPETGDVDQKKAQGAVSEYEQRLVELGAGEFDKNGNFVLKPTSKAKGWETWATVLSCCLSVVGLAMGIPIMPVNFRAITGKDTKDAQIQALQQQYLNISSGNASKVKDVESSIESGNLYGENKEAADNYGKYQENVGAYKEKSDIDTEAQKGLIDKQQEAEYKKLKLQLESNENIAKLQLQHAKDMAKLQSDLSTASAKELTEYSKAGWVRDYINECKAQGMSNKEIALAVAGINGVTPTQMGLKNAESIVGMVTDVTGAATDVAATVTTGGMNKVAGAAAGK